MKRNFIIIIFFLLVGIISCQRKDVGEEASNVAKDYYEQLLSGDYDSFISGMNLSDSVPDNYREQLVANMKMFVAQQESEHHGIKDIRVVRTEVDSSGVKAQVFLMFAYGDSTSEEILVPMVICENGKWLMQ